MKTVLTTTLGRAVFGGALLALALTSCTAIHETRGYLFDESLANAIQPGIDNRDSVQATLGTPTAKATFDDDNWYYMSQKTKKVAFFNEKVIERKILAVHFDGQGNVAALDQFSLKDGRVIDPVGRITPTRGRELTFLQQVFGNIGRYSGSSRSSQGGGGGDDE